VEGRPLRGKRRFVGRLETNCSAIARQRKFGGGKLNEERLGGGRKGGVGREVHGHIVETKVEEDQKKQKQGGPNWFGGTQKKVGVRRFKKDKSEKPVRFRKEEDLGHHQSWNSYDTNRAAKLRGEIQKGGGKTQTGRG